MVLDDDRAGIGGERIIAEGWKVAWRLGFVRTWPRSPRRAKVIRRASGGGIAPEILDLM